MFQGFKCLKGGIALGNFFSSFFFFFFLIRKKKKKKKIQKILDSHYEKLYKMFSSFLFTKLGDHACNYQGVACQMYCFTNFAVQTSWLVPEIVCNLQYIQLKLGVQSTQLVPKSTPNTP